MTAVSDMVTLAWVAAQVSSNLNPESKAALQVRADVWR
jgi:hypothetical protein